MNVKFGVHTGLQHTSIDDLRELWTRIEALGFDVRGDAERLDRSAVRGVVARDGEFQSGFVL